MDEQQLAQQQMLLAQQQQQQNYNSESDDDQYQAETAFSDDPNHIQAGWIQWFCQLEGHEFMVEVDLDFIRDPFNL